MGDELNPTNTPASGSGTSGTDTTGNASSNPMANFVTKEQLAATLRLITQIQSDNNNRQQPAATEPATAQPAQPAKAKQADSSADDDAVRVLQAQLAKLEKQTTDAKLEKQLAELAGKHKLDSDGVEYLKTVLGSRLGYSDATGFYTKDTQKTLDDAVAEFALSSMGQRFTVKDKPTLPADGSKVKATANAKSGEKMTAEELLMEAFSGLIR